MDELAVLLTVHQIHVTSPLVGRALLSDRFFDCPSLMLKPQNSTHIDSGTST